MDSRRTVVEIRNLVKNYGKLRALDGLNLSIKRGEIFGFLGPNGSGEDDSHELYVGAFVLRQRQCEDLWQGYEAQQL